MYKTNSYPYVVEQKEMGIWQMCAAFIQTEIKLEQLIYV